MYMSLNIPLYDIKMNKNDDKETHILLYYDILLALTRRALLVKYEVDKYSYLLSIIYLLSI
jgi:hypothetical protein